MNPTTFHVELTSREMRLVQEALNAMIRDCGAQVETANKGNNTTAVAYFTRRCVQADMLYDKLLAAAHAEAMKPAPTVPHQAA